MENNTKASIKLIMNANNTLSIEINGNGMDLFMLLVSAFIESPSLRKMAEFAIKVIPDFLKYKDKNGDKDGNEDE